MGDYVKLFHKGVHNLNNNIYFAGIIMIILNDTNKYELFIEDNSFTDESIEKIEIISRSSKDGYIRQNILKQVTTLIFIFLVLNLIY